MGLSFLSTVKRRIVGHRGGMDSNLASDKGKLGLSGPLCDQAEALPQRGMTCTTVPDHKATLGRPYLEYLLIQQFPKGSCME